MGNDRTFGLDAPSRSGKRQVRVIEVERLRVFGESGAAPRVGTKHVVRVEAGREEDRVLGRVELGDDALELLVQVLRAADEAHGREAEAVRVQRRVRRAHDLRVRGEAQVVVGAKVEQT